MSISRALMKTKKAITIHLLFFRRSERAKLLLITTGQDIGITFSTGWKTGRQDCLLFKKTACKNTAGK